MTTQEVSRLHKRIDELDRVMDDRVKAVGSALEGIHVEMAKIVTTCTGCQDTIARHSGVIYGNSKRGILSRLVAIEVVGVIAVIVIPIVASAACAYFIK